RPPSLSRHSHSRLSLFLSILPLLSSSSRNKSNPSHPLFSSFSSHLSSTIDRNPSHQLTPPPPSSLCFAPLSRFAHLLHSKKNENRRRGRQQNSTPPLYHPSWPPYRPPRNPTTMDLTRRLPP
ncbi:unnamed protein product, partial [Linum tenue]